MITLEMILLTKIIINQLRRNEIKEVVISALNHANLPYLPVDIKKICKSYEFIRLIPFSIQMKHRKMTYDEVLAQCQTKDACADYYALKEKYIIYYNDIDKIAFINSNRYRWSIAHELGHILLNHHKISDKTKIFRFNLSDKEYDKLESEADYFAQLLLVPHAALLGFRINASNHLRIMCKISSPASRRRYYEYVEWKSHINAEDSYDKRIFSYYFSFIFKRKCKNCGAGIIQRYGKYCPMCGSKNTLEWGDGNMKYPAKIKLDENSKAICCPKCNNEEVLPDGNYCHICGTYLVNECTNYGDNFSEGCGRLAASNARYCIYCGASTTFLKNGTLKPWDFKESNDTFMDIPDFFDSEDESLPFN